MHPKKPVKIEQSSKEDLEETKTNLLKEFHKNVLEQTKAASQMEVEELNRLVGKTNELMAKIDQIDSRLRKMASLIYEEHESPSLLTEEQKWLLLEVKEQHKKLVREVIRQRTMVVDQIKELKELDSVIESYGKDSPSGGAFLDQKK